MFMIHPDEARVLAAERTRILHDELAANRLAGVSRARTFLAASLRLLAQRLDPAPAYPRTAWSR
jgi:hypothetical protein